jgi:ornithine carbamoyltransferase
MGEPAPRHLLSLADLRPGEFRGLLELSRRAKADPRAFRGRVGQRPIGLLFEKPSTRTRVSFEAAVWTLGLLPVFLRGDELQLARGEPMADTARVLSAYLDAIVVRTFGQERLEALARAASVPVVNALSDAHHPCQALADALTLLEAFGHLGGLRLAYVGDGNNVCHSLAGAAALGGFQLRIATPPGYQPDPGVIAWARGMAASTGGEVLLFDDPVAAVSGADAVYTDVWASMGQEAAAEERRRAFTGFTVDAHLMARARPGAIFLHCLPAHRGEEVAEEVIDGPASRVWEQAANRLPTAVAILYALLSGDFDGHALG